MYLTLSEALAFYNSQLNTYYTLWVFFYTASIGIVGFVYGSSIARDSLIVKISASIMYFMLIIGNHYAISTTNSVLENVKRNIQISENLPNKSNDKIIEMKSVVQQLQDSTINFPQRIISLVKDKFYLPMVLICLGGIWISRYICKG